MSSKDGMYSHTPGKGAKSGTDRQMEYIRMLQERNRLKKALAAKSKKEADQYERERGFNVHFKAVEAGRPVIRPSSKGSLNQESPRSHQRSAEPHADSELLHAESPAAQPVQHFKREPEYTPKTTPIKRGWVKEPPSFILGEDGPVQVVTRPGVSGQKDDEVDDDHDGYSDEEFDDYEDSFEEVPPSPERSEQNFDELRQSLEALRRSLSASDDVIDETVTPALRQDNDDEISQKLQLPSAALQSSLGHSHSTNRLGKTFSQKGIQLPATPRAKEDDEPVGDIDEAREVLRALRAENRQIKESRQARQALSESNSDLTRPHTHHSSEPSQHRGTSSFLQHRESQSSRSSHRQKQNDVRMTSTPPKQAGDEASTRSSSGKTPTTPPETVDALVGAVSGLKPSQQEFLLSMLGRLDASDSLNDTLGDTNVWRELKHGLAAEKVNGEEANRSKTERASHVCDTPPRPPTESMVSPKQPPSELVEILVKLVNGWEGSEFVGLQALHVVNGHTGVRMNPDTVALLDEQGSTMSLLPEKTEELNRLVRGEPQSVLSAWTGQQGGSKKETKPYIMRVPAFGQDISIKLRRELWQQCDRPTLRVHNATSQLSRYAVRDVEVCVDGEFRWCGELPLIAEEQPFTIELGPNASNSPPSPQQTSPKQPVVPHLALPARSSMEQPEQTLSNRSKEDLWFTPRSSAEAGTVDKAHLRKGQEICMSDDAEVQVMTSAKRVVKGGRRARPRWQVEAEITEQQSQATLMQSWEQLNQFKQHDRSRMVPKGGRRKRTLAENPETNSSRKELSFAIESPPKAHTSIEKTNAQPRRQSTPAAPRQSTPTSTKAHQSTPASTTPRQSTPASTTPRQSTPASTTPHQSTPASITPHQSTPTSTKAHQSTPASTTPRQSTPASITPHQSTPTSTKARQSTPASTTPHQSTPASTLSDDDDSIEGSMSHTSDLTQPMSKGVSPPQRRPPVPDIAVSHVKTSGRQSKADDVLDGLVKRKAESRAARLAAMQAAVDTAVASIGQLTKQQVQGPPPERHVDSHASSSIKEDCSNRSPSIASDDDDDGEEERGSGGPQEAVRSSVDKLYEEIMSDSSDEDVDTPVDELGMSQADHLQQTLHSIDDINEAELEDVTFDVPLTPAGRTLQLLIHSTWGDPHYVGLAGFEIFDDRGQIIAVDGVQAKAVAEPADVNVLDGYESDPRTVEKLFDAMPHTCDDLHQWLAPFGCDGKPNSVTVSFAAEHRLGMVRLWNYNKSRTHSYRGVRHVSLLLDGSLIFDGQVRRAIGMLAEPESCSEIILFTVDADALAVIEDYDASLGLTHADNTQTLVSEARRATQVARPKTGDGATASAPTLKRRSDHHHHQQQQQQERTQHHQAALVRSFPRERPATGLRRDLGSSPVKEEVTVSVSAKDVVHGDAIKLELLANYGCPDFIGLTGLEVLTTPDKQPRRPCASQLSAVPRDLRSLGYGDDPRTLDKLVDGVGGTDEDEHMWLVPLHDRQGGGPAAVITVRLGRVEPVWGVRLWNYNKGREGADRGVRRLRLSVIKAGECVSSSSSSSSSSSGVRVLRRAPGHCLVDFAQDIPAVESTSSDGNASSSSSSHGPRSSLSYITPPVRQDFEAPILPTGSVLRICLHSSWGDPYYIGLDRVEALGMQGESLMARCVAQAAPSSLRSLKQANMQHDTRIPSNLCLESSDGWLAPLAASLRHGEDCDAALLPPSLDNELYLSFDEPISLAVLRFWNYSKTPQRGVRDLSVYFDDLLIFQSTLRKHQEVGPEYQSLLFNNQPKLVRQEKQFVGHCGAEEQDVLCINERQVTVRSKAMYDAPNPSAAGVWDTQHASFNAKRPTTGISPQH